MSNDTKWYWILDFWYSMMPTMLLIDKRLSDKQRLLYCLISALAKNEDKCCRASDEYLWECLQCWRRTVNTWIKKLIELWYLIKESDQKLKRTIRLSSVVYWIEVDEDRFPRVCITKEELLNKWEENDEDKEQEKIKNQDSKGKKKNKDWEEWKEIKEVKEVKEDKEIEDKNEKRKFDNKTKRLYWDYVSLTDEEYARLVYAFWRTEFVKDEKNHILKLTIHSKVVDDMIDNVNDRIDEKWNKAKYKDYYKALLKRFRNRKISTYYEYDNRDWENELVEHFKTDPQGNLALRYKRDHCKKKKDILDFYRLADKCWYSLTQNFDFLSESDEEKRQVEMYTDWWLVKDREW